MCICFLFPIQSSYQFGQIAFLLFHHPSCQLGSLGTRLQQTLVLPKYPKPHSQTYTIIVCYKLTLTFCTCMARSKNSLSVLSTSRNLLPFRTSSLMVVQYPFIQFVVVFSFPSKVSTLKPVRGLMMRSFQSKQNLFIQYQLSLKCGDR